jgi:hypothetical protein
MLDWRGNEIEVARSAGGVLAVTHPWDNLVRTGIAPWPTPELLQKAYQSRQVRAFRDAELVRVTGKLGFYSDLQSLHSEDAITWSVFGPICYADTAARAAFARSFLDLVEIECGPFSNAAIWLWRRLPHPETLVSGGPEIDFGIQTETAFVLGEAKWMSAVARNQGVSRERTQIELRQEFCEKYGSRIVPDCKHFVVVSVSLCGDLLTKATTTAGDVALHSRDATWDAVVELDSHPLREELRSYLAWKRRNSRLSRPPGT